MPADPVPAGPPPTGALPAALMLSAAFGGGHHQASSAVAQALAKQARARGLGLDIFTGDVVDMLTPLERSVIVGVYGFWLRHVPQMYHAFYRWTDQASEPRVLTDSFHWLGIAGLRRELLSCRPGLVVSTFPTSPALTHTVRRREGLRLVNALVLTDYRVHHHWARPEADVILLPTEATRQEMLGWGLPPDKLEVTGLPVSPDITALSALGRGPRRAALAGALGWDAPPEHPVILVSGGSGTYRAFGEVIATLGQLGRRAEVLVLAGPSPRGREQYGGATVHHLGFRRDFAQLLAGADLVIGKAGGMTVAEATALGVPLVVYRPIPGQEEYNAQYLVDGGAALWPQDRTQLRRAVLTLLDPAEQARMSAAARALGRPDAARRAAEVLLRRVQALPSGVEEGA